MESYCGIDVSLDQSSVCVVGALGVVMREATVSSEPEALIAWLRIPSDHMPMSGVRSHGEPSIVDLAFSLVRDLCIAACNTEG
ncbi:MAG: hypothetical protein ACR2QF_16670 [Geminicoccaceae bacterium]